MKFFLEYPQLKNICLSMADELRKGFMPDQIIGISRGGLTPAVIIAKELRLPVGTFFTGAIDYAPSLAWGQGRCPNRRVVFVEDVVAKGRTFRIVDNYMRNNHSQFEWMFVPVVLDGHLNIPEIEIYGIKTKHWCVMPWEDMDKMQEGDRGLFRERSDAYGK